MAAPTNRVARTCASSHLTPISPANNVSQYYVGGGLISYGPYYVDQFRRAAGYVDRILKGDKPSDMPVQAPSSS